MAGDEKIHADEGWKAQVQREREQAAQQQAESTEQLGGDIAQGEHAYPEPSIYAIITNFAAQAMMGLGGMSGEKEGEVQVDPHGAKFAIACIAVLREKTKGNLTEEETHQLNETLTQLQQVYNMLLSQFDPQALRDAGIDPGGLDLDG